MHTLEERAAPRTAGVASSIVAFAALAACSGGGGGGSTPPVSFAFTSATAGVTEGAAPLSLTVVLRTTHAALPAEARVDVVDSELGTATSGDDYAAFAPATVVFPVGSVDGATQVVAFSAVNDLLVEGARETVRFALANASGGVASGATDCTASITDANVATIAFATASTLTADESGVPHEIDVVLDLPPATTLGVAATARLADAGGGSATSGADYAAFLQQTIEFPAGSADGSTLSASLLVLDDASIEADETVRLAISTPGAGVTIGASALHEITIADDDASGAPALVVTHGASGTENGLAHDVLVDLGAQAVGGANAGTLVRLTNAGGSTMTLAAPVLTGTNPDDFDVVVDAAPLVAPPGPGEEGFVLAPAAAAPFGAADLASGPGIALTIDAALVRALAPLARVTLHGFPVPGLGEVTLDLRRLTLPIAPDAVLSVDGVPQPGGFAAAVGDLGAWAGSVLDMPGSRAFLAFSSAGARGFLELPLVEDRFVHLSTERAPGLAGEPATCRVVRSPELAALGAGATPEICGGELFVPGSELSRDPTTQLAPPSTSSLTAANCRIAIETDWQYYQRFGSTPAATTYVAELMAAISDQYFTDVQTTLQIAYLGLHTTAADPWASQDSGGDSSALLAEFRTAWNIAGWPVSANLAHFISGANLGGGVAYVGVLCNPSFGYGVSGNIAGNIDWDTWTGAPGHFTWDFVVVAHELGHNFGSIHTHSFCPPLDTCYSNCGGTTACSQGTLMSYCHTCGGMDNIDLEFHPVCADAMRTTVNASCLDDADLAAGDWVQYRVRFAPIGATGVRNANLDFAHDAPNVSQPFRVRVRGTAQ